MKHQIIFSGLMLLLSICGNAQVAAQSFDEATGNWGTSSGQNFTALVVNPTNSFLGIESNKISKEKAKKLGFSNPYGSYVESIYKNTAAHRAGVLPFDYIFGIGEYRTTRQSSIADLLNEYEPDDWVDLHLIRNNKKMVIQAKLGHEEDVTDTTTSSSAFLGVSRRGQSSDDFDGVPVNIVGNSTAQSMGMENGDKIKEINGYPILDWDDVSTAIGTLQPNEEIVVAFERDGVTMQRTAPIKSKGDDSRSQELAVYPDDWSNITGSKEDQNPQKVYQHHESAFLGINIADMSHSKAEKLGFDNPYGTYVSSIIKNSAADKGGIKPLDYIYGIDEYRVGSNQKLSHILSKYRAGDDAEILVSRKNKRKSIQVKFGSRDDKYGQKKKKDKCEDPFLGITSSSYERIPVTGVKINTVKNASSKDVGMQNGDIITKINGYQMVDWTDIGIAINMMKPGEIISVEYYRDGQTKTGNAPIKSYAETKNCSDCNCYHSKPITLNDKDDDDDANHFERDDFSDVDVIIVDAGSRDVEEFSIKGISSSSNQLVVKDLKVKSNPSKGLFQLTFVLPSTGETIVKVFNDNGRNIYEYDLGSFSGMFEDDLNLMQNGKSSYLLQVTQDSKILTKKVIIK